MGGGVTRFQSSVEITSSGDSDIQKVNASLRESDAILARMDASAKQINAHPGFSDFASKVKSGIQDPLGAAGDAVESLLKSVGPMGGALAGGIGAFAALGVAGFEAAENLGKFATGLERTGLVMGTTVEQTQAINNALQYSGGTTDGLTGLMRKLSQEIEGGGGKLKDMGIVYQDFATGKAKPMLDILLALGDRWKAETEVSKRDAEAISLLGKAALGALPDLLHLRENLERSSGRVFGKEETEQFEKWHQKIVDIDIAWDYAKKKMEQGIAIPIIWLMGGVPEKEGARSNHPGFMEEIYRLWKAPALHGRSSNVDDPAMADETGKPTAEQLVAMALNDRRVASMGLGTDEAKLAAGKAKLLGLYAGLKTGVLPEVNADQFDAIAKQEGVNKGLEAQIKATKDLAAAEAQRDAFLKTLGTREVSAHDATLDSAEKVLAKMNEQIEAAEKLGYTAEALLAIRLRESGIADIELGQLMKKAQLEMEAYERTREEAAARARDRALIVTPGQADLAEAAAGYAADAQIAAIHTRTERSDVVRQSSRVTRMAELAGSGGALDEVKAINLGYQERLALAGQLYDSVIKEGAAGRSDAAQRVVEAQAEADLHKEIRDADLENALKMAELQHKRMEDLRNGAGAFFDALLQGSKGVEAFFTNMAKGWARTVFQNMASELLKGQSGHLTLPGQGTADSPTFLGKILQGTPLGLDPLAGATQANTLATIQNTAALQAMALRGAGGSGGGFSGAARTVGGIYTNADGSDAGGGAGSGQGYTSDGVQQYSPENYDANGVFLGAGATSSHDPSISPIGRTVPSSSGGRYAMYGAAALAGGFGAYSGFKAGGAQGALEGTASILGAASVIPGPQQPFIMAAAMAATLVATVLGDPKVRRDQAEAATLNAARYTAPTGANYMMDRYGRSFDSDTSGNIRPMIQVTIPVQAFDAKSILDNSNQIMAAVTLGLEAKASPRLAAAIRNVAFPR